MIWGQNDNVLRTALPLSGGFPLREDDGGDGEPRVSTVWRVPLRGGFHGLRPLNDGEGRSPHPLFGVCPSVGDSTAFGL